MQTASFEPLQQSDPEPPVGVECSLQPCPGNKDYRLSSSINFGWMEFDMYLTRIWHVQHSVAANLCNLRKQPCTFPASWVSDALWICSKVTSTPFIRQYVHKCFHWFDPSVFPILLRCCMLFQTLHCKGKLLIENSELPKTQAYLKNFAKICFWIADMTLNVLGASKTAVTRLVDASPLLPFVDFSSVQCFIWWVRVPTPLTTLLRFGIRFAGLATKVCYKNKIK